MAATTLAGARLITSALLDDPNNRRWTTAVVDVALQQALSTCLGDFASNGCDAFDIEIAETSTAAGLSTLAFPLVLLRSVHVQTNASPLTHFTLHAQNRSQRVVDDQVARTLMVVGVREYTVPTTTTDPLIGVTTVAAPGTWAGFERWVCAEATLMLAVQDNDQRRGIEAMCQRSRDSVMARANTYTSRPLPDPEVASFGWWRGLSYIYNPGQTAPTIQLVMGALSY